MTIVKATDPGTYHLEVWFDGQKQGAVYEIDTEKKTFSRYVLEDVAVDEDDRRPKRRVKMREERQKDGSIEYKPISETVTGDFELRLAADARCSIQDILALADAERAKEAKSSER